MRPSLIVMPVLVCVPFGLAIRATVNRVTPEEQAAAQEIRDQIDTQVRLASDLIAQQQLASDLGQLYGAKPASLGSLFDGVELGMPAAQAHSGIVDAFVRQHGQIAIGLEPEYERLALVGINVGDHAACVSLRAQLRAAWGEAAHDVWLDPASQQSARIESPCGLTFAKYTPLATWIGDQPPEWLGFVGTKVEKLKQQESVEQADQFDDDSLMWMRPGLDGAVAPLRFTARVARGTIVGVSIDVRAEDETITAVFDRLEHVLGKAKETAGVSVFPGTPVVKFERFDRDHAEIRVGKAEAPESDL